MNKFSIEDHNSYDKSYGIVSNEIYLSVDYDDVNHPEVDAATRTIVEILNKYWDRELFQENLKKVLIEEWNNNKYTRADYENLEDYLNQML